MYFFRVNFPSCYKYDKMVETENNTFLYFNGKPDHQQGIFFVLSLTKICQNIAWI